jgi:hypothetical protein
MARSRPSGAGSVTARAGLLREPSFRRRAGSVMRRRAAQRLGIVSDQRFYLDSSMMEPRRDVDRFGLYSDVSEVSFRLPANGARLTYSYPPRHVYRLEGPTVDPVSNLSYDAEGRFIAESSSDVPLRRLYDWPRPGIRPRAEGLSGEYVFLPSNPSMYHWLEDLAVFFHSVSVAPDARILVARDAVRHDPGWRARREEVLQRFPDRQIVRLDGPTRVERLVLTAKTGGMGSPTGLQTLHPTDVVTIRQAFADWLQAGEPAGRYYLSRRGFSRSPRNEADLEAIATDAGFEVLQLAGLELRDQAALFSTAAAIAGIHGAALSNAIWLPPGAHVVEFFQHDYIPAHYACLAALREATYDHAVFRRSPGGELDRAFLDRAAELLAGCTAPTSRRE